MIIYGKNVFEQLQDKPDYVREIYVLQERKIPEKLEKFLKIHPDIPVRQVSKKRLDLLSDQGVHQGIAAKVKEIETCSLQKLLETIQKDKEPPYLIVVLDHIQDPHNLGAILRTAKAAGADGVILSKHESASLTPAAIKASTGAAYTLPICIATNLSQALKELKEQDFWVVGSGFEKARDYRAGLYDANIALVIGNEGRGISQSVQKQCDYLVKIPMENLQSLNASVAAGILLYEIYSQRNPLKIDRA